MRTLPRALPFDLVAVRRPAERRGRGIWRLFAAVLPLLSACTVRPAALAAPPGYAKRAEGRRGMVAASHVDAAAAGLAMLRAGGNAVDAAVATAFALSVVEPSQTGLGGGGSILVWRRALARAEYLDFYPRTGSDSSWSSPLTPAVLQHSPGVAAALPGTVAGLLDAQEQWGKLSRAEVMAPAIALAGDGFVVSPLLSRTIATAREKLATDAAAAGLYLPLGRGLRPGDRLVQSELAATLRRVAEGGAAAFYDGELAGRAVAKLREAGSMLTLADWRRYRATAKRPVCAAWQGYTVLSAAPPLYGATVMNELQLLAAVRADTLGSPTDRPAAALALIGALRLSEADAGRYRGDPEVFAVPARGLSSSTYARTRAPQVAAPPNGAAAAGDPFPFEREPLDARCAAIGDWRADTLGPSRVAPERRRDAEGDAGSNTSHFSVVDGEGNAVSVTFTVGVLFGSGVYANGFFFNSAGANLDAMTRGPNRTATSTISPTIVLDGTRVRMVVGAAGSAYIPTSIAQTMLRTLMLGEDLYAAVAAPRLHPGLGEDVEVEPGFSPDVYAALRARGLQPLSRIADIAFGGVHAILVRPDGTLVGAADPRRDGAALGW